VQAIARLRSPPGKRQNSFHPILLQVAAEKPSVTVRASVSKNHKLASLPLHPALVEELIRFRPADAALGLRGCGAFFVVCAFVTFTPIVHRGAAGVVVRSRSRTKRDSLLNQPERTVKKVLQTGGTGRKSRKRPMRVVG